MIVPCQFCGLTCFICFQTTISVAFQGSLPSYELQWKRIEQDWSRPSSISVASDGKRAQAEAHDLEPGTTYCLRLAGGGEFGPELIIDTEQVGCTPQQKSGCACVIQ